MVSFLLPKPAMTRCHSSPPTVRQPSSLSIYGCGDHCSREDKVLAHQRYHMAIMASLVDHQPEGPYVALSKTSPGHLILHLNFLI